MDEAKIRGEQFLFKALTFNQMLLVGRKTFESMGLLPDRKYAVLSRSGFACEHKDVMVFSSMEDALKELPKHTRNLMVAGGGEIFKSTIELADTIHLSIIHLTWEGDITFPDIPEDFEMVFEQEFESNINYTYQIWQKT